MCISKTLYNNYVQYNVTKDSISIPIVDNVSIDIIHYYKYVIRYDIYTSMYVCWLLYHNYEENEWYYI